MDFEISEVPRTLGSGPGPCDLALQLQISRFLSGNWKALFPYYIPYSIISNWCGPIWVNTEPGNVIFIQHAPHPWKKSALSHPDHRLYGIPRHLLCGEPVEISFGAIRGPVRVQVTRLVESIFLASRSRRNQHSGNLFHACVRKSFRKRAPRK